MTLDEENTAAEGLPFSCFSLCFIINQIYMLINSIKLIYLIIRGIF